MALDKATEERINLLARRDRNQATIREILLTVIEEPILLDAMASKQHVHARHLKIAITNWLGIVADERGEAVRCPKNVDRFHGMNNRSMETYKCDLCGLEGTPGLPERLQ
jgi:hypothetical protein